MREEMLKEMQKLKEQKKYYDLEEIIANAGEFFIKRTREPVEIVKRITKSITSSNKFNSLNDKIEFEIRKIYNLPLEFNGYLVLSPVSYWALSYIEKAEDVPANFKVPASLMYNQFKIVPFDPVF